MLKFHGVPHMNHLTGTEQPSAPLRHGWEIQLPLDRFPSAALPRGQDTAPCFLLGAAGTGEVNPFLHTPPVPPLQAGALRALRGSPGAAGWDSPWLQAGEAPVPCQPSRTSPARAALPSLAVPHLLTRKCLSFTVSPSSSCRWLLTGAGLWRGAEGEPGAGGAHPGPGHIQPQRHSW